MEYIKEICSVIIVISTFITSFMTIYKLIKSNINALKTDMEKNINNIKNDINILKIDIKNDIYNTNNSTEKIITRQTKNQLLEFQISFKNNLEEMFSNERKITKEETKKIVDFCSELLNSLKAQTMLNNNKNLK